MKNVAILIGHRSGAQGAYSTYLGKTEYEFNKRVASYLENMSKDYCVTVYERPNTPMVSEGYRISQAVTRINQQKYDLVLSLHFNSFRNAEAHGCTALHYITNGKTQKIAQRFVELVSEHFGIKERALIPIKSKDERGGTFIVKCASPAVLVEPFFGSNPSDAYSFLNKEADYASLLDELIKESV